MICKRVHLFQEIVTEAGHELCCRSPCHRLVAEVLESLFKSLVEQGAVGKALHDILQAAGNP